MSRDRENEEQTIFISRQAIEFARYSPQLNASRRLARLMREEFGSSKASNEQEARCAKHVRTR
jgi:hypothetical protein